MSNDSTGNGHNESGIDNHEAASSASPDSAASRESTGSPESTVPAEAPHRGGRVLAWLQLIRLPTVFTAMADIFLGFLLTHDSFEPVSDFALLLGASVCLYWTGMVLNDFFDRDVDAQERPGRPIPSGRIPASFALGLGVGLNGAGIGLALSVGTGSLLIVGCLTAAVWLYDGVLKKTPAAPLLMGEARFFNIMLGASASPTGELWCLPQLHVAAGLGIYVCGLTWFARQEAATSQRGQLISAALVVNAGLAVLFAFVLYGPGQDQSETTAFILLVIAFTIIRRLLKAIFSPEPELVQTAVRTMLLSLVMLDATIVLFATGDPTYAVAVALLMVPAFLLGRWIPMT